MVLLVVFPPCAHACYRAARGERWSTLFPDWGTVTSCSVSRQWRGRGDTGRLCSTPTPRASSGPPLCNCTARGGTAGPARREIVIMKQRLTMTISNDSNTILGWQTRRYIENVTCSWTLIWVTVWLSNSVLKQEEQRATCSVIWSRCCCVSQTGIRTVATHQGKRCNDAVEAAQPRIKPHWREQGGGAGRVFHFHLNDTHKEEADSEILWDNGNTNYNYLAPMPKR